MAALTWVFVSMTTLSGTLMKFFLQSVKFFRRRYRSHMLPKRANRLNCPFRFRLVSALVLAGRNKHRNSFPILLDEKGLLRHRLQ